MPHIGEVFDAITQGYTDKISRWVPPYRHLLGELLEGLPPGFQPQHILDLGAGNGNVTALLASRFPEASYTLLDASAEMLEQCARRFANAPRCQYTQAFFQTAELPAGHFDLVTAGIALHHVPLPEKAAVYAGIWRWLKPGGVFIMSDLFVDRHEEPLHTTTLRDWHTEATALGTTPDEWAWIMDHYQQYDHPAGFAQQTAWLAAAGFDQVATVWRQQQWGVMRAIKPG